jgi:hypothetical protein
MNRRGFMNRLAGSLAASPFIFPSSLRADSLRRKVKVTDLKAMMVRGPIADWPMVKIETDAGITGYGECYWGRGIKEVVLGYLKPLRSGISSRKNTV